jgi:hypothetical protein
MSGTVVYGVSISSTHRWQDPHVTFAVITRNFHANARRHGKVSPTLIVFAVLTIALVAGVFAWLRKSEFVDPNPAASLPSGDSAAAISTDDLLALTRSAIASTENLESEKAANDWQKILEARPDDFSAARNLALSRLLILDGLSSVVTNPSSDPKVVTETRKRLPAAIEAARTSIDNSAASDPDKLLATWMSTRVDLHEADLIPALAKSIRLKVIESISQRVFSDQASDPGMMKLGGVLIDTLDELNDPIDGLPANIASKASGTLATLSNAHRDNLYFAIRAARLGIDQKSKESAVYVERTGDLAQAIMPSLARDTKAIGKTPEELIEDIAKSIESGQWDKASGAMSLWFNVLNGTELVKTDRKRAGPHPLDVLSLQGLRELSATLVKNSPVEKNPSELKFEIKTIGQGSFKSLVAVDADLDLKTDLAAIDADNQLHLWRQSDGQFALVDKTELGGQFTGMLVADLFIVDSSYRPRADRGENADAGSAARHNTLLHLVVFGTDGVRLVQLDGRPDADTALTLIQEETGLGDLKNVLAAVAGDFEADGDIDLIFSTDDGLRGFVNRGNRTFFEIPIDDKPFTEPPTGFSIGDIDRDLDLDVLTIHGKSGRLGRLENLLHLQFRCELFDQIEPIADVSSIAIEDIDGDVAWDLIASGSQESRLIMGRTETMGSWDVDETIVVKQLASVQSVGDLNNDSYLEVVASGETVQIATVGFSGLASVQSLDARDCKNLVVDQFSGDSSLDLAWIQSDGVQTAINQTASTGHHLDVRFKGIDDNASGRVNHFAIGSVVEARFGPHYRAQIVTRPSTHFGIDGFETVDVRAILPNGLTQSVANVTADQTLEEEQVLKGSCPYLYAYDGQTMQFVTDCLWAAPLGLQSTRDTVVPDRPWEYLKIDGTNIRPRKNTYDFRITEELWEVAYFDQVEMMAIDHPADTEVWTNEKVGPDFIATPTTFVFDKKNKRQVHSAKDTDGNDVSDQLRLTDRNYVKGFDYRLRQGLCPPHHVDITFNETIDQNASDKIYLVMNGWILPTDTSLNIQIDQNPSLPSAQYPSLWVPDAKADGGWREAIAYMGFPGGKTKTIVVDVTEVANRSDLRFRIATSAQIYWDSAEMVVQSESTDVVEQPMQLVRAEVDRHGFSRPIRSAMGPDRYAYDQTSMEEKWPPLSGPRTQFGDCTPLLEQWDDQMVVIASGDEIRMQFQMPLRDLPAGWVRDFVMHNVGWDKDADLNTLEGQSTLPLPYRTMSAYPPPADQTIQSADQLSKNQNHLTRTTSMRSFWRRGGKD